MAISNYYIGGYLKLYYHRLLMAIMWVAIYGYLWLFY
jgi:hypothetical protein